jgi:twitching motility protein PilJ
MAFKLKLPKLFSGARNSGGQTVTTKIAPKAGSRGAVRPATSGANHSITRKMLILGAVLMVLLLTISFFVYRDYQEIKNNSVYIAAAGELRMLSQRIAKGAGMAMQGDSFAFMVFLDSRHKFVSTLEHLRNGGQLEGTIVPPSPQHIEPYLDNIAMRWAVSEQSASQLLTTEARNVVLASLTINEKIAALLRLSEQLSTHKSRQPNASAYEIAAAGQLMLLTQRVARNTDALRLVDTAVNPGISFQLGKDTNTLGEHLLVLSMGSDALRIPAASDAETRRIVDELNAAFRDYKMLLGDIVNGLQGLRFPESDIRVDLIDLVLVKQMVNSISINAEGLLYASNALVDAYQTRSDERVFYETSLAVLTVLVLALLAVMFGGYLKDQRLQTRQAEIQTKHEIQAARADELREESDKTNRQNQDAILRLMNELGDLADGDLTVTATVSEDITGAIADSINYTIEELRVLVGRINDAAGRVTSATEIAQRTSVELLDAAHLQSLEIKEAGHSVLEVASSMSRVSSDADQSARVANQSLVAAGKGNHAVQDSIKGMHEIRRQIQETSKRIKRLGESSQEIGEIVELISDITEQTNVLALNAAIQAASAGDAGRGFTVVAEEVQRLAERSGEATKQIAAIVKTIQSDTQGAVLAMEESTREVVEGAKLSDAAGQALAEIGTVSRNLAELIKKFSDATRRQADAATGVAGKMQNILKVTEQTTVGTQKTASAVGELAGLATELKGSVAGFKVD